MLKDFVLSAVKPITILLEAYRVFNGTLFGYPDNEIVHPESKHNMKYDEHNIYVEKSISLHAELPGLILNEATTSITVGDNSFDILVSDLWMKREQYYRIKNQGIPKSDDIYNISEKSDIIVKIIFF